MPGIRRKFSGPNGYLNFIADNNIVELTRNPAGNVIRIDMTGPHGENFYRIITRNLAEQVTDIGYWITL